MISIEDLAAFVVRAKAATYVGDGTHLLPSRPGSTDSPVSALCQIPPAAVVVPELEERVRLHDLSHDWQYARSTEDHEVVAVEVDEPRRWDRLDASRKIQIRRHGLQTVRSCQRLGGHHRPLASCFLLLGNDGREVAIGEERPLGHWRRHGELADSSTR
jgi:hypothetical protein